LALLGGCESFYEGPTRTSRDSDSRYTMQDRGRSDYDRRYGSSDDSRATPADSTQRVTSDRSDSAERAADRTRASSNTRSAAANTGSASGNATRVQRDGDRTRYTMAYPTGDRDSSVMLVEKTLPSQVRLGQSFDYEIKVTNTTDATLDDVRIQEQTPEGLSITGSQPERQGQGADAGWQLGALKPRESKTIKVSGKADKQGELGTCLFASYKPSLCAAVNVVNPQIRVTKVAPQQADICENIEYRYTVTNTGSGSTERVTVREDLPEGLTTQDGRNQVVLDAGRIEAGQSKEGVARLKASRAGSFASHAVASSEGGLKAQTEDITVRVTQPKLGVSIEGPENEYVNRPIAYRVTVTNEGDSPAREASVAVNIPQATRVANVGTEGRADRNAIQWSLGTHEPRASKTVTFNLTGTEAAALETTARARAVCAAEVSGTARTKLMTIAALLLEAVDLSDPVRAGENVVYRITVTNQGSGPDTNIRVTAKLPAEEQYVSARGSSEATAEGQTIRFAPIPTLAAGRSAQWELTATAKQAGDVRFDVQLESDSLTKPGSKSEPTRLY
jgi:uncharacterized repeat protein (TIGR01451 family)